MIAGIGHRQIVPIAVQVNVATIIMVGKFIRKKTIKYANQNQIPIKLILNHPLHKPEAVKFPAQFR